MNLPMVDLDRDSPADLLAAPLAQLAAAIRARSLTEADARTLDHAYRHRLLRLVHDRAPEPELLALADHLRAILLPSRRGAVDALGAPWSRIWDAYAEILESRATVLRAQAPRQLLGRAHVAAVFAEVRAAGDRGTSPPRLLTTLGLKKSQLARVLHLMEANELIECRAVDGRENQILLGYQGRRLVDADLTLRAANTD